MRTRHHFHLIVLAAVALTGAAACSAAAPSVDPIDSNAGDDSGGSDGSGGSAGSAGSGGSAGSANIAVTGMPSQPSAPAPKWTIGSALGGVVFSGEGVIGSGSSSSGTGSTGGAGGAGGAGGTGGTGGTGGAGDAGGAGGGATVEPALPVISDTCGGVAYTLTPGLLTVHGTTTGAADDYQSLCGDAGTPDVAYAITLPQAGSLWATVSAGWGSSLQPVIDIRTDCASPYLCSAFATGTTTALVSDMPAGTYYIIIDGSGDTSGDFDLTLKFAAPECGDGVVNAGEECDMGAGTADDGCGDPGQPDACKLQPASGGGETCPGQLVEVSAGTTVLAAESGNSTYGFVDDYEGSCSYFPGGVDRVYQIVPAQSGTLTVSVGYEADGMTSICDADLYDPRCWGYQLYARSSCDDAASELGCAMDSDWPFQAESLSFPVAAGSPYFVFVDGYDEGAYSMGVFNLVLSLD